MPYTSRNHLILYCLDIAPRRKTTHPTAISAIKSLKSILLLNRTGQWRYAEYGANGANGAMLFDEKADPLEMTNPAAKPEHKDLCAQFSTQTRQFCSAA